MRTFKSTGKQRIFSSDENSLKGREECKYVVEPANELMRAAEECIGCEKEALKDRQRSR